MTSQKQAFFHDYRAMDTRVLLLRYHGGGLLPDARAALLEVLADRDYAVETLEDKGADEIATIRVNGVLESRSVPERARRSLSMAWRWLKAEAHTFALRAGQGIRLRKTWAQVARIGVLLVCLWSALQASLFGAGGFVAANVFCDSGPWVKCFHMGLRLFGVGVTAEALLIPAILALLFQKKWLAWYLKTVPVLSLLVFAAAIYWYRTLPALFAEVAEQSALIALLVIAYLILSRTSVPVPAPESA